MPPPIPVPSKAAIHALRGLALGTSCALGLIVEDRRRRICTLRTAIDNKKKLRTSRKYHGAAEAISCAADDAVVLTGDELHWHYRDKLSRPPQHEHNASDPQLPPEKETTLQVHNGRNQVPKAELDIKPNAAVRTIESSLQPRIPGIAPIAERSGKKDSGGWATAPTIRARATPDQIITEISDLSVSSIRDILKQPGSFATYKAAFISGCRMRSAFKKVPDQQWLKVSEALCTHCHAAGLWPDAQEILLTVTKLGEVDESRFYAHGPILIIESLLSNLEADDDSRSKQLCKAVELFLAKFPVKPKLHADEVLALGETLISRLLQFNHLHLVHQVFWRILGQQEHPEQFTAWFIQSLHDYQDHRSVVKYFKVNFTKMTPNPACFNATVQLVIEAVDAMRGAQAEQVMRALAKQCRLTGLPPQVGWIIKILQSHWNRHEDLQKSRDFFSEIVSLNLLGVLDNPEEIYQIMVKLSVLADDNEAAQHYYQQTVMLAPRMTKSVWLNGYMALMKAKAEDWDGVFSDFSRMRDFSQVQRLAYDQTFVAILKVFIQGHTISEVEDFIKLYMKEMDVRLHRYMVTLVANKYGASHDHEGLVQWLRYCGSNGLALDPAFSNAILRNLRLKWKLPYYELRKLHSSIQKMEPEAVDHVSTRVLHSAAMEEGNYSGSKLQHRFRILGTSPSKLLFSKSANERDIIHAMTEELVRGSPAKAVVIWKRALRFGMPWCPKCFLVAIKASLQRRGGNFDATITLIGDAHGNGHDVTPAVTMFIKAQVNQFRGTFAEVMTNLQSSIARFEALGVLIDASTLTETAIMLAQFQEFDWAIDLCKLAMEKSGATNPCHTRQSFRALLMAYWQTLDAAGLRWLVESLPSSALAGDKTAYKLLQSTKRHMAKWVDSPRVNEMKEIIQTGIEQATQQRSARIEAGSIMYNETLRIMSDAAGALDSEQGNRWKDDARTEPLQKTLAPQMRAQVPVEAFG